MTAPLAAAYEKSGEPALVRKIGDVYAAIGVESAELRGSFGDISKSGFAAGWKACAERAIEEFRKREKEIHAMTVALRSRGLGATPNTDYVLVEMAEIETRISRALLAPTGEGEGE